MTVSSHHAAHHARDLTVKHHDDFTHITSHTKPQVTTSRGTSHNAQQPHITRIPLPLGRGCVMWVVRQNRTEEQ